MRNLKSHLLQIYDFYFIVTTHIHIFQYIEQNKDLSVAGFVVITELLFSLHLPVIDFDKPSAFVVFVVFLLPIACGYADDVPFSYRKYEPELKYYP